MLGLICPKALPIETLTYGRLYFLWQMPLAENGPIGARVAAVALVALTRRG
jgi:hypothetical protein